MAADAPGLTSSHRAGRMAKWAFPHSVLFLVGNLRKSWQTSYISLTRAGHMPVPGLSLARRNRMTEIGLDQA